MKQGRSVSIPTMYLTFSKPNHLHHKYPMGSSKSNSIPTSPTKNNGRGVARPLSPPPFPFPNFPLSTLPPSLSHTHPIPPAPPVSFLFLFPNPKPPNPQTTPSSLPTTQVLKTPAPSIAIPIPPPQTPSSTKAPSAVAHQPWIPKLPRRRTSHARDVCRPRGRPLQAFR